MTDNKLTRQQVYELLDGERAYQDSLNPGWDHKGFPTVEAEILMMEEYLRYAREKWVNTPADSKPALDMMRKVAGMAVRCFENHGCPARSK